MCVVCVCGNQGMIRPEDKTLWSKEMSCCFLRKIKPPLNPPSFNGVDCIGRELERHNGAEEGGGCLKRIERLAFGEGEGVSPEVPVPVNLLMATPGRKGDSGCAAKPLRGGEATRVLLQRRLAATWVPANAARGAPSLPEGQQHPENGLPSEGGGKSRPGEPGTRLPLRSAPQQNPRSAGSWRTGSSAAAPHQGKPEGPKPPRESDARKKQGSKEARGGKAAARPYKAPDLALRSPAEPGGGIPAIPFVLPVLLPRLTC